MNNEDCEFNNYGKCYLYNAKTMSYWSDNICNSIEDCPMKQIDRLKETNKLISLNNKHLESQLKDLRSENEYLKYHISNSSNQYRRY